MPRFWCPRHPAKGIRVIETSIQSLSGEERFQLLLDAVTDYAIYLLDATGCVVSWNTGAQRFKGYTAAEIVGQHFSRFYTDGDRAAGLPELALRTAVEEGRFEAEGWRVRKDGSRFWTSVVIDPVFDRGVHIGFAKITRDITERRLAQEEVERTRAALAQAQKMEAIGRLTGGVAHDFNNLLTVICSSADLLRRPGLSEDKRARYVEAIAETAERAALLTKQLLAFSRRQPLKPEVIDVGVALAGLEHILATTLGAGIMLTVAIADDLGPIKVDPGQFENALLNLVVNARDAMPGGGTLRIAVRNVDRVPPLRQHAEVEGRFVAIDIVDSGTGIDAETLPRIFEPFFTTKDMDRGTGLGLSQVYGFAKQSGGDIDVASTPGIGTTFTLYLPRARNAPAPRLGPNRVADALSIVRARRILLVEDNEAVGRFARDLLEDLDQQVTWASDADIALALLDHDAGSFDLVFSDVVMPGMNGIELAHEIVRRWSGLKVVLTSGYSHVLTEEGSHGFELLHKPYSVADLVRLLQQG